MLIIMDHIAAYHNLNDDRPQASRFFAVGLVLSILYGWQ